MTHGYDNAAAFYDRLSRLVYGDVLLRAQRWLLQAIPAGARVLIAGGGAGWILTEIARVHPSGLVVDYIDASPKMIALAKKKDAGDNTVTFINAYIEDADFSGKAYDVVITPFLFDNFTDTVAAKVFSVLAGVLKQNGLWLWCDFEDTGKIKHKLLLKAMYTFFRRLGAVKAVKLPDMASGFTRHGYRVITKETYMDGFIAAIIYQRYE